VVGYPVGKKVVPSPRAAVAPIQRALADPCTPESSDVLACPTNPNVSSKDVVVLKTLPTLSALVSRSYLEHMTETRRSIRYSVMLTSTMS
jgi:hypothetical protein